MRSYSWTLWFAPIEIWCTLWRVTRFVVLSVVTWRSCVVTFFANQLAIQFSSGELHSASACASSCSWPQASQQLSLLNPLLRSVKSHDWSHDRPQGRVNSEAIDVQNVIQRGLPQRRTTLRRCYSHDTSLQMNHPDAICSYDVWLLLKIVSTDCWVGDPLLHWTGCYVLRGSALLSMHSRALFFFSPCANRKMLHVDCHRRMRQLKMLSVFTAAFAESD